MTEAALAPLQRAQQLAGGAATVAVIGAVLIALGAGLYALFWLLAVVGRLLIDLRAQYRFGFYNNPIRSSDSSSGTDTWSLTAHLGVEF